MIYARGSLTIRLLPFYGPAAGSLLRYRWLVAGFHTWSP